jgi:RNA polymerase sigma-70 factor (ECF subfamily)
VDLAVAMDQSQVSSRSTSVRPAQAGTAGTTPPTDEGSGEVPFIEWTDLDLVAGLFNAREDAYSEIYRRHSASVTAAARMILIRDHRCEDVVAEVFVSLWCYPEKFDPARGTLLAYLRLKARGRSIDMVRSDTARTRRETSGRPSPQEFDGDGALIGAESSLAVREALVQLPAGQREAIVLAFYSGLSYLQVAVRLGIPEGTAKSRIRAGLSRLRQDNALSSLGGDCDGDGTKLGPGIR